MTGTSSVISGLAAFAHPSGEFKTRPLAPPPLASQDWKLPSPWAPSPAVVSLWEAGVFSPGRCFQHKLVSRLMTVSKLCLMVKSHRPGSACFLRESGVLTQGLPQVATHLAQWLTLQLRAHTPWIHILALPLALDESFKHGLPQFPHLQMRTPLDSLPDRVAMKHD